MSGRASRTGGRCATMPSPCDKLHECGSSGTTSTRSTSAGWWPGDAETERHFTRYFGELLVLKLRSRLRSPAQVEDARQETFVRVLSTLKEKGGLASAESLGAFVNGVCNNVLFEMYRANARTTPLEEEYDEASSSPPADLSARRRRRARGSPRGAEEPARAGAAGAQVAVLRRARQERHLPRPADRPRLPSSAGPSGESPLPRALRPSFIQVSA